MEHNETALKHRNGLLSAILQCDGMEIQYLTELIEEFQLDVDVAVLKARENLNGFSFNILVLYLLNEAFEKTFSELGTKYDPAGEHDLDLLKFRDYYLYFHLDRMDSHIIIKKQSAIQNGWPEGFIKSLSEKIAEI